MNLFAVLSAIMSTYCWTSVASTLVFQHRMNIKLCKRKCKFYSGCTSVGFQREFLQCELIFGSEDVYLKGPKDARKFKVQHNASALNCSRKARTVVSKQGIHKCVKGLNKRRTVDKEKLCGSTEMKKRGERKSFHIIHKEEDLQCQKYMQMVQLPVTLKPGMKLTVYGACVHSCRYSSFSITLTDGKATHLSKWFKISSKWTIRRLYFTAGHTSDFKGAFPFSDPSNFSLALELSHSATKIYADQVLVKSIAPVIGVKDFTVNKYRKIHILLIEQAANGCT